MSDDEEDDFDNVSNICISYAVEKNEFLHVSVTHFK